MEKALEYLERPHRIHFSKYAKRQIVDFKEIYDDDLDDDSYQTQPENECEQYHHGQTKNQKQATSETQLKVNIESTVIRKISRRSIYGQV